MIVTTGGRGRRLASSSSIAAISVGSASGGSFLDRHAELAADKGGGVEIDLLVDRRHDAQHHQLLDNLADFTAHLRRQILDGDRRPILISFGRIGSGFCICEGAARRANAGLRPLAAIVVALERLA
jgi:hypothetical protein